MVIAERTTAPAPEMPAVVPSGQSWDAIVVGAGHNGLVAAAYLARAGLATLVVERREQVGGIAATVEVKPGARVPAVAHTVGRFKPSVVRELGLRAHGLTFVAPDVRVFAPSPDGSAITLYDDVERTADGLRARSGHDAANYAGFDRLVRSIGRFLAELGGAAPPDIHAPSLGDALTGLKLTRAFRGLGKHDARSVLRVLPMAVADFVAESFETDALRGVLAARGIQNTAMGPWSAGTTAVFLADSAGNDGGAAGQTVYARGGPGALSEALAAAVRAAGGQIRTGAEVVHVTTHDGRASGVVLALRRGDLGPDRRRGDRPEAGPDRAGRSGHPWAGPALASRQHPDPGHGRQGQPRPRRVARLHGGRQGSRRRAPVARPDRHRPGHRLR